MTREEFSRASARLVALWPKYFADSTLAVYFEALSPLEVAPYEATVKVLARTSDRPPSLRQVLQQMNTEQERAEMQAPMPALAEDPLLALSRQLDGKRSESFKELAAMVKKRLHKAITQAELEAYTATWEP